MIRFLSSTKLAIALCLLLAAEGVAGSLLYKGNTAFGEQGPFHLFRSAVFVAPAVLLVVNILVCAGRRLAGGFVASRAWTFAGIHLGLVLLAAGMIADGLWGFVGTNYYRPGDATSGYFNWRTHRDENFPFTVDVAGVEVRHHPLNLRIGIRDAAGKKIGVYTVREGVSFRVTDAGVVVTPRRFDAATSTLLFDAESRGSSLRGLAAGPQGSAPVAGVTVVPVSWHDPEPSDFVARVRFAYPGRSPEEKVIRVNHPATFSGLSFCLVGEADDRYRNAIVGLQMTREPGEPVFWGGGILFGMSLLARLALRSRRDHARAAGPQARERAGTAAIPLLAAAALALAASPVRAASGVVIAADATWEGDVIVASPVTVEKGATLRIRPGTRVRLSGEDRDADGCRDGSIQVFGRLVVEGERERPVRFLALTPGLPWQELFMKDASGIIRYAEFSGALWGLHIHDGDVRVEQTVLRGNGGGARVKGRGVSFTRCTFRDNGLAIRFWDGGPAVESSVIEGNGVGLFYREGAGGGRFRGNRIGNREWNLKVGDWVAGDLDLSGNWWSVWSLEPRHPAVSAGWGDQDAGVRHPAVSAGWSVSPQELQLSAEPDPSDGRPVARDGAKAGWGSVSLEPRHSAEAPASNGPSEVRGSAQAGQGAAPGAASLVQDYREKKETGRIRLEPALHEPPAPCGADILVEEER